MENMEEFTFVGSKAALAKQKGFELDMHLVRGSDQDVLDATFWNQLV